MIQHKTIESVLQRGEKLDNLVERSNALSTQSKMFYKTAKKVHITQFRGWHSMTFSIAKFLLPYHVVRVISARPFLHFSTRLPAQVESLLALFRYPFTLVSVPQMN